MSNYVNRPVVVYNETILKRGRSYQDSALDRRGTKGFRTAVRERARVVVNGGRRADQERIGRARRPTASLI